MPRNIIYSIYFQTQNTKQYCMMVQLKIKHKKIYYEPIKNILFDNFVLIVFVENVRNKLSFKKTTMPINQ